MAKLELDDRVVAILAARAAKLGMTIDACLMQLLLRDWDGPAPDLTERSTKRPSRSAPPAAEPAGEEIDFLSPEDLERMLDRERGSSSSHRSSRDGSSHGSHRRHRRHRD